MELQYCEENAILRSGLYYVLIPYQLSFFKGQSFTKCSYIGSVIIGESDGQITAAGRRASDAFRQYIQFNFQFNSIYFKTHNIKKQAIQIQIIISHIVRM
jgi:hypothetical protein